MPEQRVRLYMLDNGERRPFGLALTLDDVPSEVTRTNGEVWTLGYEDNNGDPYAIYVRKAA